LYATVATTSKPVNVETALGMVTSSFLVVVLAWAWCVEIVNALDLQRHQLI
jgi:hypothetical protein